MDIVLYLDRISYQGPHEPSIDALWQLYRARLLTEVLLIRVPPV